MESPASPLAALRVALDELFVSEASKSLAFLSLEAIRPGFVGVETLGHRNPSPAPLLVEDRDHFPLAAAPQGGGTDCAHFRDAAGLCESISLNPCQEARALTPILLLYCLS